MFFAINEASLQKTAFYGFVTGATFYFLSLSWVINTIVNYGNVPVLLGYLILALLVAYLSFYVCVFCVLCQKLSGGSPLYFSLVAPFVWTALEFIRSTHLEYGFSWLGLGYSQYKNLIVIQIAEFTGVYGVSTLIVWINASLFFIIHDRLIAYNSLTFGISGSHPEFMISKLTSNSRSQNMSLRMVFVTILLMAMCLGFGYSSLNQYPVLKGNPIKVSLIQGNIAQDVKWNSLVRDKIIRTYERLTLEGAKSNPDLIIWPEAATPYYFGNNRDQTKALKQLVARAKSPLLFGSPYVEMSGSDVKMFNSAWLLNPNGETSERYDKIHLVPFGEFVPMQSVLFFVEKMVQGIGNFGRGNHEKLFHLGEIPFGTSICYEITFPALVRKPVNSGARFLINITNDAWFGNSAASYQHFSMAALRAVENRVPIIRSANTGISGTIDPLGRISNQTPLFQEAIVNTTILPGSGEMTIYARYGDWFCWFCLGICILVGILIKPIRV
ncbi:MAG: apolipoprotein N-acyltransferase [Acidiferrobacteraceae bacterium]|nr:apolipoprotein N-acyltransferase [Acidiferrobacteraceae bacterium]